jgi:hypothetical protein
VVGEACCWALVLSSHRRVCSSFDCAGRGTVCAVPFVQRFMFTDHKISYHSSRTPRKHPRPPAHHDRAIRSAGRAGRAVAGESLVARFRMVNCPSLLPSRHQEQRGRRLAQRQHPQTRQHQPAGRCDRLRRPPGGRWVLSLLASVLLSAQAALAQQQQQQQQQFISVAEGEALPGALTFVRPCASR